MEFRVRLYTKDAFRPDIAVTPWRLFESTPVQTFTLELIQTGGAAGLQELSAEGAIEAVDLRTGDRTFTLVLRGVTPGFYDIAIEANHTLVNLRDDVPVHTLMGILDMGTKDGPNPQPLREGNAIDDPRPRGGVGIHRQRPGCEPAGGGPSVPVRVIWKWSSKETSRSSTAGQTLTEMATWTTTTS